MIKQLVLLAGGLATRMFPVTKKIPKAMLDLNGNPFIHYQLELFKKNNISDVVICAGYLAEQIEDFVGDGSKWGINVRFSVDGEKLLGTGGAIRKAYDFLDNVFFVMYGDSYLPIDFQKVAEHFKENKKKALMTIVKNDNQWDKSNVVFQNGSIVKYDKKETLPEMKYIDYGLGILSKAIIEKIRENEVCDLADIYSGLVNENDLLGYEMDTRFYEIGSFKGLEETKEFLLKGDK